MMAAMPRDGLMQGSLGSRQSVEAVLPPVMTVPMAMEPQVLTILWTGCRIGPNTAIAAAKFHNSEIGAHRRSCPEDERH